MKDGILLNIESVQYLDAVKITFLLSGGDAATREMIAAALIIVVEDAAKQKGAVSEEVTS